jgi:pimeloyl-ACP methyl ester carboxylesterase
MSAGGEDQWGNWLAAVADGRDDLHLVGHSVGASVALEYASKYPERVRALTLVAPAFLQPAPGIQQRLVPLTAAYFRFVGATSLARKLLGSEEHAGALETSVIDLRRPGVARRVGRILSRGAQKRRRDLLLQRLLDHPGEVHVIIGENDPLSPAAAAALRSLGDRLRVTTIAGAGHYPQITHPDQLVDAIEQAATVRDR